ncbi:MAG: hypothetical protein GY755_24020 [Chloroflexi bacterium]|nr:hypothetical protein [Chloroflexota bacterium]
MRRWLILLWLLLSVLTFLSIIGCATSFETRPLEEVRFQERSQTQDDGQFRVTASVLSADETEAVFGFALYKKGIQPIWLEIENKDDNPTWSEMITNPIPSLSSFPSPDCDQTIRMSISITCTLQVK